MNNQKHGRAVLYLSDDSEFWGYFKMNNKHGKCFEIDAGNQVTEIIYHDGI